VLPYLSSEGIHIETDLPPDLPFVDADIALIERVLENLLDNAVRHTPAGAIRTGDDKLAGSPLPDARTCCFARGLVAMFSGRQRSRQL
jgi:signal transduction histidine kinase